jgi:peptide/nickel transport system substrate-binding protein
MRPLRIAVYSDPLALDPHLNNELLTLSLLSNVYEGLTAFDGNLRVRPALADSWDSPNDLLWRFHLRAGVRFHDGRPLTAEDVAFSLERARHHPRSGFGNYLVTVSKVRAGTQTVEVTTDQPSAILLNKLAWVMIVPAGSPEEIRLPVGTGPYRFVSWNSGQPFRLRAFKGYWGGAPPSESVEFVPINDPAERERWVVAGQADLAVEISPAGLATVEATPGCHVAAQEGLRVDYLQMRVDRPPFSDPRVRQAVDLALDRDGLVRSFCLGHGRSLGQLVSSIVFGYDPSVPPPQRDLTAARRLLEEAGLAGGFDVDLEHRAGRQVAELKRQLGEAGIRVRSVERPWSEMFTRLRTGEVGLYYGGVLALSADASDVLDSKIHTPDPRKGYGEINANHYSNPALDLLIERSRASFDMLERRAILQRCMRMAMADRAVLPLFAAYDLYGMREEIDWRPRLDGRVLASEVRRRSR